jgi:hypothetical protein
MVWVVRDWGALRGLELCIEVEVLLVCWLDPSAARECVDVLATGAADLSVSGGLYYPGDVTHVD